MALKVHDGKDSVFTGEALIRSTLIRSINQLISCDREFMQKFNRGFFDPFRILSFVVVFNSKYY